VTAARLSRDPGNALVAIADLAKATPNPWLVGIEAAGFAVALGIWIWIPGAWRLSLPFLSMSAYGIWGVIEHIIAPVRRRQPTPIRVMLLRPFQFLVAAAGIISATVSFLILVGNLIGTAY
jgi:hypothetical protein